MRAAIYARMSTDKQSDTSPEDQIYWNLFVQKKLRSKKFVELELVYPASLMQIKAWSIFYLMFPDGAMYP